MNERILELARQIWPDPNISHANHMRFAELLLNQAITVVQNTPVGYQDYRSQIEKVMRDECVAELKHHFGVQEPQGWVCPKCGVDRAKEACPSGHHAALTGHCPMIGVAQ